MMTTLGIAGATAAILFAAGAFRLASRKHPCPACRGIGLVTYDELSPADRRKAGFGSVFICPTCEGRGEE